MWYMHDFGGWWMVFGGIFMVLFWGGIIALAVWGVNKLTKRGHSSEKEEPIDIARERYARGHITRDEFERMKNDLK
jgi:putative membrane protein